MVNAEWLHAVLGSLNAHGVHLLHKVIMVHKIHVVQMAQVIHITNLLDLVSIFIGHLPHLVCATTTAQKHLISEKKVLLVHFLYATYIGATLVTRVNHFIKKMNYCVKTSENNKTYFLSKEMLFIIKVLALLYNNCLISFPQAIAFFTCFCTFF